MFEREEDTLRATLPLSRLRNSRVFILSLQASPELYTTFEMLSKL